MNHSMNSASNANYKAQVSLSNLSLNTLKNIADYKNEDGSLDAFVFDFYSDSHIQAARVYAFAKV